MIKANASVVFKGIEKKDGGSFTNEKGQVINFKESCVVRFDLEENGSFVEKKAKFSGANVDLYNRFKSLKTYDKINLSFEITLYNNMAKLEILDFSK